MSLNPFREKKTFRFIITGSSGDFDAIADIIETAAKQFNIDLYPEDVDVPGRIALRKGEGVSAWQYPRVGKVLKELPGALREDGDSSISFGGINIDDMDRSLILDNPTLRSMNEILSGNIMLASEHERRTGRTNYMGEAVVDDLESMLNPMHPGLKTKVPLSSIDPQWVYATSILQNEADIKAATVNNAKDLEKLEVYPPDFREADFWAKHGKPWKKTDQGYNRAYFIILRTKKTYSLDMPINTIPGKWDSWIKTRPVPKSMEVYIGRPPKTFSDLLERFAVYTAARSFGLKDAYLAPATPGLKNWNRTTGSDKILAKETVAVKSHGLIEYVNFYGFLVVGKGPRKVLDITRSKEEDDLGIPSLE